MFLSSAIITVHLENLRHNLKTLLARHPSLMPVIKADAYGHGVVAVARVLAEEGIQHMAVGSVGEGALLRQEGHTAFLLALMGLARDEDTALAASYDITPLVHSRESLERILAQSHLTGRAKPLTVAIKFDTGMSRLGFRVDEAAELADYLRTLKEVRPVLVMSHLAASDTPALDDFTHEQARRFHEATESMKAVFPGLKTSLTNSPGLLCWPSYVGDLASPGVTLYGGNPLHGADRAKLGLGLCDTPYTRRAAQAILTGKRVDVPTEEVELYRYASTAPAAYYAMMKERLDLLLTSGVVVCSKHNLEGLLLGGAACEAAPAEAPAAAEPSAPAPMPAAREEKLVHVTKRVLTERDIRDAAAEKVTCIHVPAKCILTALAKDCAKEHGIRLVQE